MLVELELLTTRAGGGGSRVEVAVGSSEEEEADGEVRVKRLRPGMTLVRKCSRRGALDPCACSTTGIGADQLRAWEENGVRRRRRRRRSLGCVCGQDNAGFPRPSLLFFSFRLVFGGVGRACSCLLLRQAERVRGPDPLNIGGEENSGLRVDQDRKAGQGG